MVCPVCITTAIVSQAPAVAAAVTGALAAKMAFNKQRNAREDSIKPPTSSGEGSVSLRVGKPRPPTLDKTR